MTNEATFEALDLAAAFLDTSKRAWIVGVAHLSDLPLETEALSEEKVRSVLEIATSTVDFPSGPISYIGPGFPLDWGGFHSLVTVTGGEAAPHLEVQIGFGQSGFIAFALTRSDVFDDGSVHVGGVPLTDLESVVADTYVLAVGAALAYGYTGPIDIAVDTYDTRPDVTLVAYAIDEDSGALEPAPIQEGFTRVTGSTRFDENMTPRSAHADIHNMAMSATAPFGVLPQLTSLLDASNEAYSSSPLLYQDTGELTVWGP